MKSKKVKSNGKLRPKKESNVKQKKPSIKHKAKKLLRRIKGCKTEISGPKAQEEMSWI